MTIITTNLERITRMIMIILLGLVCLSLCLPQSTQASQDQLRQGALQRRFLKSDTINRHKAMTDSLSDNGGERNQNDIKKRLSKNKMNHQQVALETEIQSSADDLFPGCIDGCNGHGQCENSICKCDEGWEDKYCSTHVYVPNVFRYTCAHLNDCSNHGFCNNGTCICDELWNGSPNCDSRSICKNNCSGHGVCESGKCCCDDPWSGEACEFSKKQCDLCIHGNCIEGICVCNDEWFHGPHCDILRCPAECSGHGICHNGTCECLRDNKSTTGGWIGADCSQYTKIWCPKNCTSPTNGKCLTRQGTCHCNQRFSGPACEFASCENDCNYHGQCIAGSCVCVSGYKGNSCEIRILPSGHGGVINGIINCDKGWSGDRCDQVACPNNCNNKGFCLKGKCICRGMWKGVDCSVHAIREYDPQLCRPGFGGENCDIVICQPECVHGKCDGGVCVCDAGWDGAICDKLSCPSGNCSGHGECKEGICDCEQGWTLSDCSLSTCPHNCSGHGDCMKGTCVCYDGWGDYPYEGLDCSERSCDKKCKSPFGICNNGTCICFDGYDISEMSCQCPKGCSISNADCIDGLCVCKNGWHGINCDQQDCPNHCSGHGECINTTTSNSGSSGSSNSVYSFCSCFPGWGGNDCSAHVCYHDCWNSGNCQNGICSCYTNFKDFDCHIFELPSGHGVIDIALMGTVICDNGWNPGTNILVGPPPFKSMDNITNYCINITCPSINDFICSGNGQCNNGTCVCNDRFGGDSCADHLCLNECMGNGVCDLNTGNCTCDTGFTEEDCSIFRLPLPAHGQIRSVTPNEDLLECDTGYAPPTCIDFLCYRNCSGHGLCLSADNCLCDAGWIGSNCSISVNYTCGDHGQMLNNGNCLCDDGFSGPRCETDDNAIKNTTQNCPNNCTNTDQGKCINGTCSCYTPYSGEDCSIKIIEATCAPLVCTNNCSDHGICTKFGCKCHAGYLGDDCSTRAYPRGYPCPNECFGNGQCKADSVSCWCDAGYDPLNNCQYLLCPDNCSAHGVCDKGKCQCDLGWAGFNCHIELPRRNQWALIQCKETPGKRYSSTLSADIETNDIFLFGGLSDSQLTNDIWKYTESDCWSELVPLDKTVIPHPRFGHCSLFSRNQYGRRVYVFGGQSDPVDGIAPYYEDLWAFDVDKLLWFQMVAYGPTPSSRSFASISTDPEEYPPKIYLFGGSKFEGHDYEFYDDLWSYDLSTTENSWGGNWKQIYCTSKICPKGRSAHGLTVFGGLVTVFGGKEKDSDQTNDLYTMDIKKPGEWEKKLFGGLVLAPSPRTHFCYGYEWSNEFVYTMTGHGEGLVYEDVWRIRPFEMDFWEDMNPKQDPSTTPDPTRPNTGKPLRRESGACVLVNSQFFLYGGMDKAQFQLNDFWLYDFRIINLKPGQSLPAKRHSHSHSHSHTNFYSRSY